MGDTIWKYELTSSTAWFDMPKGAKLLTVQTQGGNPCLWAQVDPDADTVRRCVRTFGTGHPGVEGDYVGTFQLHGGSLVFHLFDLGEVAK